MYITRAVLGFILLSIIAITISTSDALSLPKVNELIIDDELIVSDIAKLQKLKTAIRDGELIIISEMVDEVELANFYNHLINFMKNGEEDSLANVLKFRGKIKNLGVILGDYYLTKAKITNRSDLYQKAYDFYLEDKSDSHRPIYNSALMLYAGKVKGRKCENYLSLFKKAIKLGSYNALAYAVNNDLISFEEAIEIMSSRNELVNLLSLGAIYYNGIGNHVNYKKSLSYFNRAYAEYKSDAAAFASAQIYYDYLSDTSSAKKYYQYAVELGHCEAKNALGTILLEEKKIESAKKMFGEAYSCGLLNAGFNIAMMKLNENSIDDGLDLLATLSEKGYANASYNLGIFYMIGKHTEKDLELSEKYLQIAHEQGHENANKFLLKLKRLK